MRALLIILLSVFVLSPAHAQDGRVERLELAKKLSEVNPVARQIESSIMRVAENWKLSEKEKFSREMMAKIDMAKIEMSALEALADTFTKEELQVMIDYYSKPEAAKIAEKMPVYQGLIQPSITKEMDRALMALRTGYEAESERVPAP